MNEAKTISVEFKQNIAILHFKDPSSANGFSLQQSVELEALLRQDKIKQAHGLIWLSEGHVFCSGGHLKQYAKMSRREGIVANRKIRKTLKRLSQWPTPTIAYIQGDALGGGIELLSCFDYVFSAPHAFYGLWQRKIGLSFGWGGGGRLLHRLGAKKLQQKALSATVISAYEALSLGLIDKICQSSEAENLMLQQVQCLASLPRVSFMGLKQFRPQSEVRLFERLWFNSEHRSVLERFK